MNTAKIKSRARKYYLNTASTDSEWVLHRQGCDNIKKLSVFLGTLYTDRQALGTAKKRFDLVSYCHRCIPEFPT